MGFIFAWELFFVKKSKARKTRKLPSRKNFHVYSNYLCIWLVIGRSRVGFQLPVNHVSAPLILKELKMPLGNRTHVRVGISQKRTLADNDMCTQHHIKIWVTVSCHYRAEISLNVRLNHNKQTKHIGSILRNARVACEIWLYVTTKKVWLLDRQTDSRIDRQTPAKVIPMCRYASQETQKP